MKFTLTDKRSTNFFIPSDFVNGGKWFLDRTQFQTNSFVERNKRNSYLLNSYHFHESKNNIKKVFIAFLATKDEKRFLDNGCFPFLCCEIYVQANRFFKLLRFKPSASFFSSILFPAGRALKKFKIVYLALNFVNVCLRNLIFKSSSRHYCCLLSHESPVMLYPISILADIYFHPFSWQHSKLSENIKLNSAQLANILKMTKNRKFTRSVTRFAGF